MSHLDFDFSKEDEVDESDNSQAQAVAEKVLHFMDGAPLYDRTHSQRVEIEKFKIKLLNQPVDPQEYLSEEHDQITIDGKPVHFGQSFTSFVLFGEKFGTEQMFVTDVKECPERVIIYEREKSKQLKAWCVDTTQPIRRKIVNWGGDVLLDGDVLLAQTIASVALPQPIES